jgi:hypothetical protein
MRNFTTSLALSFFVSALAVSACSSEAPAGPVQSGDLGFRPAANGFKFENYTDKAGSSAVENLTAVEMRRLFGDGVCASLQGDACTLAPQAKQWMDEINKGMSAGHCEGMAVMSKLFFAKKLSPSDFGAEDASKLDLEGNSKLQREIAFWWATQATSPTAPARMATMKLTPVQIADQLGQAFKAGPGNETYTIAFFKKDMTGGHAVTPYAVVPEGERTVKIMVYDNNYPGAERAIVIDRVANTWRYNGAQNPNEPGAEYAGDATSNTLGFTPSSVRAKQQECTFCGSIKPGAPAPEGPRQLQHNGEGNVVVRDGAGHETGVKDGKVVSDIPGSEATPTTSGGPEYWKYKHDPIFKLPGSGALTVTLDGSTASSKSKSDVAMVGPGYVLAVDAVDLAPGQKDTITFSADNTEITYKTSALETPVIVLGAQLDGADYLFLIRAHGTASGVQVDIKMDLANGKLRMTFNGAQAQGGYDVEVHRIDDAGEQVFTHAGNNESDGDVIYLDYAQWMGQGSAMTIEVDQGGDGSVDSTTALSDQE